MIPRTTASPSDAFAGCASARGLTVTRLTAWSAWETFADFATMDLGSPAAPDADALLYQWGTFAISGRPQFHLVLSRQIAVDAAFDADTGENGAAVVYEQFDCRLRFELDPTLSGLGRFESWWVADGETALTGWIAEVSGRPEWPVLAPLPPVAVEIESLTHHG